MELLIASVREHKALYDPSDKDYMRTKFKDEIWDGIAKYLDYANGQDVKDTWRKLRDCHRDALRRQFRKKNGSAGGKVKLWVYQKQMEFLLPYMINRTAAEKSEGNFLGDSENSRISTLDCEGCTIGDCSNSSSTNENIDRDDVSVSEPEDKSDNLPEVAQNDRTSARDSVTIPRLSKQYCTKKQKIDDILQQKLENHDNAFRRKEIFDDRIHLLASQEKNSRDQKTDILYQFFLCMFDETKQMPEISQLRIKKKLFEAVQFEEEIRLSGETSDANYGNYQIPSTVECLSPTTNKNEQFSPTY